MKKDKAADFTTWVVVLKTGKFASQEHSERTGSDQGKDRPMTMSGNSTYT